MRLSRTRQIFCIPHLAQIAAMADQHILIEKPFGAIRPGPGSILWTTPINAGKLLSALAGSSGEKGGRNFGKQIA